MSAAGAMAVTATILAVAAFVVWIAASDYRPNPWHARVGWALVTGAVVCGIAAAWMAVP